MFNSEAVIVKDAYYTPKAAIENYDIVNEL